MASSTRSSRPAQQRPVHQDFIARIRYSNALPPPPNPPKLLHIPNTGLSSGQYTNPGFASRLARDQPLNIEADAELGMPLDLVGLPGIFYDNESSIEANEPNPTIHPHDRVLLRPLAALGKSKLSESQPFFLRRAEYVPSGSAGSTNFGAPQRPNPALVRRPEKRRSVEPDAGTPASVKRKITHSFAVTEQYLHDPSAVKPLSKKRPLHLVDSFPLLPDLESFPDSGAYVTMKFANNPIGASRTYDSRLLAAIFKPVEQTEAEQEASAMQLEAHERDPKNNPKPDSFMDYDLYIADTAATAEKFRQRFDVDNANRDDDSLYPDGKSFKFSRVRAYETANEVELDHRRKYEQELILSLNRDETDHLQKAAYYYPVMQRTTIKPQRNKNIAKTLGIFDDSVAVIDQLDISITEPAGEFKEYMEHFSHDPEGLDMPEPAPEADVEVVGKDAANGHDKRPSKDRLPTPQSDEQDAEGEDDD